MGLQAAIMRMMADRQGTGPARRLTRLFRPAAPRGGQRHKRDDRHWRRPAVVVSLENPKSLAGNLDILGDAAVVDDIGTSVAEFDAGGGTSLTKAEALALTTDR